MVVDWNDEPRFNTSLSEQKMNNIRFWSLWFYCIVVLTSTAIGVKEDDSSRVVLSLGSVQLKELSDQEIIQKIPALLPEVPENQSILIELDTQHGSVNLLRHANHLQIYIYKFPHVIFKTSPFQVSAIRNDFLPHFRPHWPHAHQLSILIDTKYWSHCVNVLRFFKHASTRLDTSHIHLHVNHLFQHQESARHTFKSTLQMSHTLLPNVENVVLHVYCSSGLFKKIIHPESNQFTLQHFRWFQILLDKLDTYRVQFKFKTALSNSSAWIKDCILQEMKQIWKKVGKDDEKEDDKTITFIKDTRGCIKTDDHVYIPAHPFWQKHNQKNKSM